MDSTSSPNVPVVESGMPPVPLPEPLLPSSPIASALVVENPVVLPKKPSAPLSPKKTGGVWTLAISPRDTGYGKSRSYISPPNKLTRVYPDQGEQELWFNYEDREIYYPVVLLRDGKKPSSNIGNVYVTMEVSEKKQTPPAVVRASPQKGVYWFKAVKAYVFGEIYVKFEVTDERPNIEPVNRVSADPLSFTCRVDVDEFGHPPPLQPEGTTGDTVVDYVYEFDPRQQQARQRQQQRMGGPTRHVQQTYHTYVPHNPLNPGAGGSHKRKTSTTNSNGESEYEKKTKYEEAFLRPPRKSYKDYDEHAQTTGIGGTGTVRSADEGTDDDDGTAEDTETGSNTFDSDYEGENTAYPSGSGARPGAGAGAGAGQPHSVRGEGGLPQGQGQGLPGRETKSTWGLDHALFDVDPPLNLNQGVRPGTSSSTGSGSSSSCCSGDGGGGGDPRIASRAEKDKAVQAYEEQIETLSNTLGVSHAMQCTRFAVAHLQFLERKERALPSDVGVKKVNVQQLRDLLKAKRSLEEALAMVLRR